MARGTKRRKANSAGVLVGTRLNWYRCMSRIRAFEREILVLNKAGLIPGTAHLYIGMEATAVGACAAMREQDLLTSTHRGHGHCIARGLDMRRMMAEILGRSNGCCGGKGGSMHIADIQHGMLGADGIVGGGIPIAVGAALGLQVKPSDAVVFCFFGEGASNQGAFHEGINLAAILRLPVVFICENNQWALSAEFTRMTAGGSVASRACAYGVPGEVVDGNDVEAVFRLVSEAAARALQGLGPSLLECQTYRWEGHSIFTRQDLRPKAEVEEWKRRDPIERYRSWLLEGNLATVDILNQIESEVATEVSEAVEFAKKSPLPSAEAAFQDLYSSGE